MNLDEKTILAKNIIFKRFYSCFIFYSYFYFLYSIPDNNNGEINNDYERCRGLVLNVDNSAIEEHGLVISGTQIVFLELLDGSFKKTTVKANNFLRARMETDKVFKLEMKFLLFFISLMISK